MSTFTKEQALAGFEARQKQREAQCQLEELEQVAFVMFKALQIAGGYTTLPPKLLDKIDAALAAYREAEGGYCE